MASQPPQPPSPPAEAEPDWRQRFEERWGLRRRGVPLPPEEDPDGKRLLRLGALKKPFERNLLQSPNPEGVNIYEAAPPCPPSASQVPLDPQGNFKGWQISIEPIPEDSKQDPLSLASPRYSWRVKEQRVDLLAEGLWEALLDLYQPNITVMDWYEHSKLASSVYELHVQLLGADGTLVIGEFHHVAREHEQDLKNKNWFHVSHLFKHYGPGVRYIHFQHKTKGVETPAGFLWTRATDSSVSVQLRD
ncbi:F-box only protein 50 [Hemicordylus capensis]|uniref:F-box only protein 50 n=1 Tax=Hemicordylus capensis TaxID=884348 RepID=UPI002304AACA|nr:F-box only protein 50 [Hemicordylus capensis]